MPYLANMAALWRTHPRLAWTVDRLEDHQLPELTPTRSGKATVRGATPDGRPILLHSAYDPDTEARDWAARMAEEERFCYIVSGFGLGYHVRALFDELPEEVIIVVLEADLAMLRLGLSLHDFSSELQAGRMVVLTRPDKGEIHQRLFAYGSTILLGTRLAAHPPSVQLAGEFHAEMQALITEFIEYTKTAMVTLVVNAQITCENVACNLATYLSTPPLNALKGRFTGYPAFLVAAGPSLHRNVHHLAAAQGKAVIIATQTTFKSLLKRGIIPNFVCSLDYHEFSKQYYEGIEDFHGVHLVAEPKTHPGVTAAFGGPVSLLYNDFAELCLGPAHPPREGLRSGASVAHLTFYLAEYLGCDPIVLVGQDLAFTNHVYYAPGMAMHAAWQPELNRFCTIEMKEWERIMRNRPILRRVRDHHGRAIYTENLLMNYLEHFERDFASTQARVIDATEGGAAKRGARPMPLAEAIAQFCTRPLDTQALAAGRSQPQPDPAALCRGREAIAARIGEMEEIQALCDQTIEALQQLKTLVDRPAEFNQKIKRVDRLRLKVREFERAYNIIACGAQMAEFRKFNADVRLKASRASGAQRAIRQLDRDLDFVTAMRRSSATMIDVMRRSLEHFDAKTGAA